MGNNQGDACTVEKLPKMRNIVLDIMEQGEKQHNVHGIFEVNVTKAKKIMRDYKARTGESLSFTGYIVYVAAQMVEKYKYMHAIRVGTKVYTFDDVDVNIIVERNDAKGNLVPVTYIIRRANKKSYKEIHEEIRAAKNVKVEGSTVGASKEAKRNSMLASLPKGLRKIIWGYMHKHPAFKKASLGTVNVTSIGIFGKEAVSWAIPITPWPLTLSIGTFSKKLVIENGTPTEHEMLHMTVTINHDVVDGSPATRALRYLADAFNDACGLEGLK